MCNKEYSPTINAESSAGISSEALMEADEIKITDEMIDAGIGALAPFADFLDLTPPHQVRKGVADLYRAMRIKDRAPRGGSFPDQSRS